MWRFWSVEQKGKGDPFGRLYILIWLPKTGGAQFQELPAANEVCKMVGWLRILGMVFLLDFLGIQTC